MPLRSNPEYLLQRGAVQFPSNFLKSFHLSQRERTSEEGAEAEGGADSPLSREPYAGLSQRQTFTD